MHKALVVVLLKVLVGVLLGASSFLVAMFVGGAAGTLPAFMAVAAFLFGCQFLLSWGHVDAHRKDWPVMLALVAPLLVSTFMMILVERLETILDQGPVLLFACAGIYAGAATASRTARRRKSPLSPKTRQ